MFAIRETLAINTARALALLISHPKQEERAREELVWRNDITAQDIHNLKFLEACVQEAMRLWPSTPFVAREAVGEEVLEGSAILPGTQVLILNTFNHRDRETSVTADTFYPDQWFNGIPDLPYNHLSGGTASVRRQGPGAVHRKGDTGLHCCKRDITRWNGRRWIPQSRCQSMLNHFRLSMRIEK
jgi:cytochrome P450